MHLYNFPRTFCSELEKFWEASFFSGLRETSTSKGAARKLNNIRRSDCHCLFLDSDVWLGWRVDIMILCSKWFLNNPRPHPSHGLIITGIFLSPSPNVVFISCSCFGGNNSLTRDIMLDTSPRLYQLSRKPSPNWCNSFSCFSRRRTWNWKNVSQRIKLG